MYGYIQLKVFNDKQLSVRECCGEMYRKEPNVIGIHSRLTSLGLALLIVAALVSFLPPAASADSELVTATVYSGGVDIQPRHDYSQAVVTVSGNGIVVRRVLEAGDELSIELYDLEGEYLPDGSYNWSIELVPDARTARELRLEATENDGKAPNAWLPETGTFAVINGQVASPDTEEISARRPSSLDSGLPASRPGSEFKRTGAVLDDDAAVGSRQGFEEDMRTAGAKQGSSAGVPSGREIFERSDAGAQAMGGSIEAPIAPSTPTGLDGAAPPAPRSISPDGKDGRPRSKDESR